MDYKQACLRLDTPRAQTSKNIGHKLKLYYDGATETTEAGDTGDPVSRPNVSLTYFNTDIITWYPNGGVRIGARGFWDSRCTLDKINEYLPRGWRMMTHRLRFNRGMLCAFVTIRTDKWEFVRSMPYEDNTEFYEDGRVDHKDSPFQGIDASSIVIDVATVVEESVMAFLYGELKRPTIEADFTVLDVQTRAGIVDRAQARSHLVVEVATGKKASSSLVWGVIDAEYKSRFRMSQLALYDPAVYPFTGTARTNKESVAQMEYFMRVGDNRTRYKKNSEEFHAMKKDLMAECELFLLRELGFEVKEYERRPRSDRWCGW